MGRFAQTADLLSVIQTCRRQGRSVMEFFRKARHGEVGEWDIPAIFVAPTDYLNPYYLTNRLLINGQLLVWLCRFCIEVK